MSIITITQGSHSGAESLAESVASALGARCVSREVLLEAAKNFNVPESKVAQVFEKTPSFWERMTESRRTYLAYIQATLTEWAADNNLVYYGNGGQELLRGVPHALKVRVLVPAERRIRLTMEHMHYSREQAEQCVTELDDQRSKRMRYMFNADWKDPLRYDVVIHLDKITQEYAQHMILELAQQPPFVLSDQNRQQFTDFLIRTRVYAILAGALVGRLSLITVTVENGTVTLQGTLTSHESMIEQIVEDVRRMPNVKAVNNEIVVGLVYHEWNV